MSAVGSPNPSAAPDPSPSSFHALFLWPGSVLQIKDIPRRPAECDGLLCLGGIQEGTNEKTITAALQRFGEIEDCMPPDQSASLYRVKFKDHSAAEEATKAPKVDGLYDCRVSCE